MNETIKGPILAEMLGISPRHLGNLEKVGAVVKSERGEWLLRESVRKFCEHLRNKGEPDGDYEADKARLMKAKADRAEIETAQRAGKLVMTDRIGKVVADAIGIAVSKLMQVGDKVAPLCILEKTPAKAAELINAAVRAACEEICEMDLRAIALDEAEAMEVPDVSDSSGEEESDESTD